MKKIGALIVGLIAYLMIFSVCYAGDIVSPLLTQDDAQVYFGKVVSYDDENVTVAQVKNIKGDFEENRQYTYERKDFTTRENLEIGKIYLCATPENRKGFMIWEISSMDEKPLNILSEHDFAKHMEECINDGQFEHAEIERSTLGQKITFTEFIEKGRLSENEIAKVNIHTLDKYVDVDKDEFFKLADKIMVTNVKNRGYYELGDDIKDKEILCMNFLDEDGKLVAYAAVTEDGGVDRYSLFMSRLIKVDYEMEKKDLKNLKKFITDKEAVKIDYIIFLGVAFLVIAAAVVVIIVKVKRKK